jgi:hypothetical protein
MIYRFVLQHMLFHCSANFYCSTSFSLLYSCIPFFKMQYHLITAVPTFVMQHQLMNCSIACASQNQLSYCSNRLSIAAQTCVLRTAQAFTLRPCFSIETIFFSFQLKLFNWSTSFCITAEEMCGFSSYFTASSNFALQNRFSTVCPFLKYFILYTRLHFLNSFSIKITPERYCSSGCLDHKLPP